MNVTSSIINQLHRFRALKPAEDFSARSRRLILASTPVPHANETGEALRVGRFSTIVVRTIFFTAGTAITIAGIFYGSQYFSPLFLPGLNQDKIVAEADMINGTITIQLSQLHYFDTASQVSAQALNQITDTTSLNHLNATAISDDTQQIQTLSPTDTDTTSQQIQDILKALQK
jgi:hypothetical protein